MIAVSASCGFKGLSLDPRVGESVHPMYFSPGPVQSCSFFQSANWVLLVGLHGVSTPRLGVHQPGFIFPCIPVQLWLFESVNWALFVKRNGELTPGLGSSSTWLYFTPFDQMVLLKLAFQNANEVFLKAHFSFLKASWGLVPRVPQCIIPVGIPTINYSE